MLDWENLPFISSQSPYVELLRPADPLRGEGVSGRDVEFAFYGWSRRPLYSSSGRAWPLDDDVFARIEQSRTPFWTELQRGDDRFDAYIQNDRGGIYALGFPIVSALGHLVNLAELTVLAWLTYAVLLAVTAHLRRVQPPRRHRAGAAARGARELLPQAVARLRCRHGRPGRGAGLRRAAPTWPTRCARTSRRRRSAPHRGAARRRGPRRAARRAAGRRHRRQPDGMGQPPDRPGRQHLQRTASAGHERAQPVRVRPAAGPDAGRRLPRTSSCGNEAATVTPEQIGSLEYLVAATPMTARDARRDSHRAAHLAAAGDREPDRHARIDRCCLARCCSSSAARSSATGWPSASRTR